MFPLPLQLLLLQYLMTAVVVGFTLPSSQLRVAAFPIVLLCSWISVTTSMTHITRGPWASLVGGYSITFLLQYISLALLSRWSFRARESHSGSSANPRYGSQEANRRHVVSSNAIWVRLKYGIAAAATFRDDKVKSLRSYNTDTSNAISTRPAFLRHTALKILVCYLILDFMGLGAQAEANAKNFANTQIPFFSRLQEVTTGEVAMRIGLTIATGTGIYCSQEGLQSIVAFLAVAVRLSDVEDWRPRFGNVAEAYSLRQFWR